MSNINFRKTITLLTQVDRGKINGNAFSHSPENRACFQLILFLMTGGGGRRWRRVGMGGRCGGRPWSSGVASDGASPHPQAGRRAAARGLVSSSGQARDWGGGR